MKKIVYGCMIGLTLSSLMSCKKDKDPDNGPSYSAKADDASARTEIDKAYDDVESVYKSTDFDSSVSSASPRTTAVALPCGNVSFNKKTFKIQYGGVNCGTRVLSGSIDVSLISGTKFADLNAILQVDFHDYEVYYNASKQSIIYNGTTYITNKTGGSLVDLFTGAQNVAITYKVRGSLSLAFDTIGNGTHGSGRIWNLFRTRTYANIPGNSTGITLTIAGDTTVGTSYMLNTAYNNASEYGISSTGYKFVSVLSTPFKWENCGTDYTGPYILKQGKVEYTADLNNSLIPQATWAGTAGYKYTGMGAYTLDGSCGSNAYKLDADIKKADGTSLYSTTSYQPY